MGKPEVGGRYMPSVCLLASVATLYRVVDSRKNETQKRRKKVLDKRSDLWENTFNKRVQKCTTEGTTYSYRGRLEWLETIRNSTTMFCGNVSATAWKTLVCGVGQRTWETSDEVEGHGVVPKRYQLMISSRTSCTQAQGAAMAKAERLAMHGACELCVLYRNTGYSRLTHWWGALGALLV